MGSFGQRYYEEGKAQGMAQGMAQGEAKGAAKGRVEEKADSLARLLTRRFGALSEDVRQRIIGADYETLNRWFDLAIDAPSLDAVFGHAPNH